MAKQENLSVDEAVATYGWQEEFNKYANSLAEKYPDSYAAARVTGPQSASLSFVSTPPDEVREDSINGVKIAVIGGLVASEKSLDNFLQKNYYLARQNPAVVNSYGDYDSSTATVNIEVELSKELEDQSAVREAIRSQLATLRSLQPEVVVSLKFVDQAPKLDLQADARGGGYLDTSTGGDLCTWGFTVGRNSTSVKGLSTAGHCSDAGSRRYYYHGASTYATVARQAVGSNDLGWYSSGSYTATPMFFFDYSSYRTTTGRANPSVGSAASNFGRTNGAHTGLTVYAVNFCSQLYCNLTSVNRNVTAARDSGGPWFLNNTAYGIHSGVITTNGVDRSAFTPVQYLSSLNLTVLTAAA